MGGTFPHSHSLLEAIVRVEKDHDVVTTYTKQHPLSLARASVHPQVTARSALEAHLRLRSATSRRASWTAAPPTRQPLSPLSHRPPFPCGYSQPYPAVPAGKPLSLSPPPVRVSSLPVADARRDTRGTTGPLSPLSHMRFHARDFTCYSRASHGMPAGRCTGQFGQRKLVVNPKLVTAMQVRENEDEMEMRVVEHAGLLLPVSRVRR